MNGPDYENAERLAWEKNIDEVCRNPSSRRDSIERDAKRKQLSEEVLWYQLATNTTFAANYAKDPVKQSIHQKTAAAWIGALPLVDNFKVLPGSNKSGSLYLDNGRLLTAGQIVNDDHTKSIDFHWRMLWQDEILFEFYASHKFTRGAGGAQDNQYKDVRNFVNHANKLEKASIVRLLVICDGDYYDRVEEQADGKCTKLQYLQGKVSTAYAHVCSSADLPEYLLSLLVQKLSERKEDIPPELSRRLHGLKGNEAD